MKEPGKLLKIARITDKERGQLSDLLDNSSGSNTFRVLENFLGEQFILFLDIFQGEVVKVPSSSQILQLSESIKIYNDSAIYELDYLAKKYKKNPSKINEILQSVHEKLKQQGGETIDDESD